MDLLTVQQQLNSGALSSLIINGQRQVILPRNKVLVMKGSSKHRSYTSNAAHNDFPPDMAA